MKVTTVLLPILVFTLMSQCCAGGGKAYLDEGGSWYANPNVKMALHLIQHTGSCKGVTLNTSTDIVSELGTWSTDPSTGGIDAFLVVFDYDSITGIEYGLSWPGDWGTASTKVCLANPIAIGGITNPGDGISISWAGATCKIPSNKPGGNSAPFLLATSTWVMPTGAGDIWIRYNFATGLLGVKNCRDLSFRSCEYPDSIFSAAVVPPTCDVDPVSLDFGVVGVGAWADRTFTITNIGTGTISGSVSESCAAYSVVGNVAYNLAPGYAKTFTVRFSPQTPGLTTCDISTGLKCHTVACTGSDVAAQPITWGAIKATSK